MFVSLDSDDLSGNPADHGWKIHHGGDDSSSELFFMIHLTMKNRDLTRINEHHIHTHIYIYRYTIIYIEWASARVPPTPLLGGSWRERERDR